MKKYFLFSYLFWSFWCFSQEKLETADLGKYLNKNINYCDKVAGTFITNGNSKIALISLGAPYPNQVLTVAIFEKDWKNFNYKIADYFNDKTICVSGKLILYNNKPEIIVKEDKQIKLNP